MLQRLVDVLPHDDYDLGIECPLECDGDLLDTQRRAGVRFVQGIQDGGRWLVPLPLEELDRALSALDHHEQRVERARMRVRRLRSSGLSCAVFWKWACALQLRAIAFPNRNELVLLTCALVSGGVGTAGLPCGRWRGEVRQCHKLEPRDILPIRVDSPKSSMPTGPRFIFGVRGLARSNGWHR